MKVLQIVLIVILTTLASHVAALAQTKGGGEILAPRGLMIFNKGPVTCAVDILGPIDAALAIRSREIVNYFAQPECRTSAGALHRLVRLQSPGGDINAAMRIGEMIRQAEVTTVVPLNSICASACVLLHVAGVKRMVVGRIGLHRTYSTVLTKTEVDAKRIREMLDTSVREYLKRMNVPEALLTSMNSTPPENVRWIDHSDEQQLRDLFLSGEDPVYADLRDSRSAEGWGISKQEYYRRSARASALCTLNFKKVLQKGTAESEEYLRHDNCLIAVMRGER